MKLFTSKQNEELQSQLEAAQSENESLWSELEISRVELETLKSLSEANAALQADLNEVSAKLADAEKLTNEQAEKIAELEEANKATAEKVSEKASELLAQTGHPAPVSIEASGDPDESQPKKLSLSAFNKLTPAERMNFVKSGGKLTK